MEKSKPHIKIIKNNSEFKIDENWLNECIYNDLCYSFGWDSFCEMPKQINQLEIFIQKEKDSSRNGRYLPSFRRIDIFAGNHTTSEELMESLWHEIYHALEDAMPEQFKLDKKINGIKKKFSEDFVNNQSLKSKNYFE